MDSRLLFYLGFSHFLGIGPTRFATLLKRFSGVKKAYLADQKEIGEVIGQVLAEKFVDFRRKFDPIKKLQDLKQKNITTIALCDSLYPKLLKEISDPPICLYVKGELNSFNFESQPCFAIVGTRTPTSYGQQIARKFATEMVEAGFTIVSGMAVGVDAIAHQAAIAGGGKTIAFLGCGVDIIYPAINAGLYRQILQKGGLVASEFPPGQTVAKGLFIARNRLISGVALGVLVVEGAKDSGAMITARYAGEQGREVFAPPAPLTSKMSQAPNTLLKQGAKLVTSVEDIFEEFNMKVIPKRKRDIAGKLIGEERIVFEVLLAGSKSADELSQATKITIGKILNILSFLEIKNIIEKDSAGEYRIKI